MDERESEPQLDGALLIGDADDLDDDDIISGSPGDGKAEEALNILSGILERMGLRADAAIREDGENVVLDIDGEDTGRAIGKKGQTLDALQFLVNKIANRFPENRRYIVVDAGDYRERHDTSLVNMARREAKRAVEQGRTITLSPMPARDRRLIHLSLAKFDGVTTRSNGEGMGRRIQIIPSRGSQGGGAPRSGGGGRRRRR